MAERARVEEVERSEVSECEPEIPHAIRGVAILEFALAKSLNSLDTTSLIRRMNLFDLLSK